jgi:hypothetical protein
MSMLPDGPGEGNLVPRPETNHAVSIPDVSTTLSLGQVFAESGLFPDTRAAAQAVVKVLAGRELGFGPVASMTGINVIKGRITLSANLIAAAIRRSGRYDYRVRRLDDQGCEIEFLMAGMVIGISTFTVDDARKAGLAGGDNWRRYPRNMLFSRAVSNGAKWYAPDVFGGAVYTPDELDPQARLDPETGALLTTPAGPVVEAEVVEAEPAIEADGLHARVAALVAETHTDLSRVLTHYRATVIDDLSASQCAEAIRVLLARKKVSQVSVP